MRNDNLKRLVAVLLSFTLVVGAVTYRPQRANAFAVTSGAIVAGVCAIMASIGVSYWANSPTDAQDFIAQKLDDYLQTLSPVPESLQDWLGLLAENTLSIFQILSGNRLRFTADVGNKILDFVRWFVEQTGITGGGEPVILGDTAVFTQNSYVAAGGTKSYSIDGNTVTITLQDWYSTDDRFDASVELRIPVKKQGTVQTYYATKDSSYFYGGISLYTANVNTANLGMSYDATTDITQWIRNSDSIGVSFGNSWDRPWTGTLTITFDGVQISEGGGKISPSEVVNIPNAIPADGALDVVPSATISQVMSVDDAAESIFDAVASDSGLTATVDSDVVGVPSAWVWLSDLITGIGEKIDGLAHGIAEAIAGLFVPADGFVADFVDSLYATFSERVGVLTYPLAVAESFMMRFLTETVGEPVLSWGAVQEPFSGQVLIQAGSYNLNDLRDDAQMMRVYDILQLVLKAGMAFALFELCHKKYNSIIHGEAS